MDDDSRIPLMTAVWRAAEHDTLGATAALCAMPLADIAEAREALALAHRLAGNLTADYPAPAGRTRRTAP